MKKLVLFLITTVLLLNLYQAKAQVGIGTDMPNPSTQLEIISSNRGIMIPQVPLTSNTDQSTITAGNLESLLVYNINTNATLTPGYYYWYQGSWNRLLNENDLPDNIVYWDVQNGQFTYIDENGDVQIIDIADLETLTFLGLNTDGHTLEYTDEDGIVTSIDLETVIDNFETVTTIVDNGDGTFTYTDEDGNTTIIDVSNLETLTYLALNPDGKTLEYTDEDGIVTSIDLETVIDNFETVTTIVDNGDGTFTYTDEDGNTTVIDVSNLETLTYLALNPDGKTLEYTDEDGIVTSIDLETIIKNHETVTTLVNNGDGTYTFTNEDGVTTIVYVVGDVVTNIQNQGDIYDEILNIIIANSDTLVDNGDGTLTHTTVDGDVVTFKVTQSGIGDPITVNPTTGTAGDIYVDESTGDIWSYDGTTWVQQTGLDMDADATVDAWIDDATNERIHLGTLSDGTTARPVGTNFQIGDNGHVAMGDADIDDGNSAFISYGFNNVENITEVDKVMYASSRNEINFNGTANSGASPIVYNSLLTSIVKAGNPQPFSALVGQLNRVEYSGSGSGSITDLSTSINQTILKSSSAINVSNVSGTNNNIDISGGAHNVTALRGTNNIIQLKGNTATISNLIGSNVFLNIDSPTTITDLQATSVTLTNSKGNIENLYGFNSSIANSGSGSITNAYGYYANFNTIGSNTIANSYGFYAAGGAGFATNHYALVTEHDAGNVGLGTIAPTNQLHVVATEDPVKLEGLQAGSASDKLVVADTDGVLKTVDAQALQLTSSVAAANSDVVVTSSVTDNNTEYLVAVKAAMPKFFYMPAIIFDTSVNGSFTRNLHAEYEAQFTGTGNPTLVSSTGATNAIPTLPATELEYHITYYDTAVFANLSIDANGVLSYDIIGNATDESYMTIVFVVK